MSHVHGLLDPQVMLARDVEMPVVSVREQSFRFPGSFEL